VHRRVVRVIVTAAIAASSLLIPIQGAQAAGCVSRREYRKVHQGDSKNKAHRVFGTKGKQTSQYTIGGDKYQDREYKTCTSSYGFVMVSYKNGNVTDKFVYWG
jgi:hypothetical protein